jgi:integrase
MPNKPGHRRFGSIRKLPSGRYQIRYQGPDGQLRSGADTYESRAVADRALSLVEAQVITGEWTDPVAGKVRLGVYAQRWIDHRPGLRPRTVELYEWLLRRHISPYLGNATVAGITPDAVRDWRARLLSQGVSESATAKAYRLLRAVLATAADDRAIARNPCRIRGGGDENPAERPVLTIRQVYELAAKVSPRYRALVLVLTFASLRWGEAIALRRCDVDLGKGTITVRRQYVELSTGHQVGPPKSRAGSRTVAVPAAVSRALAEHIEAYVSATDDALVFTGALGGVLRRGNFRRDSAWKTAASAIGVDGLHVHDLRHTGNTLAAQAGTSLADLKARMGHDSARAALIYQHATTAADRKIADALSRAIELAEADEPPGGRRGLMAR